MTSEVPCLSGQWLKQESHSVLKEGVLVGNGLKNNISVRTGEEFSMEFLQDRGVVKQVENGHGKVLSNGTLLRSNGNQNCGFEELSVTIGLRRMDSVCSSDSVSSLAHGALGSGVSDDSRKGKVKFICSSGGKIMHRPSDGKLRYVGGESRIVSIQKSISLEELAKRTSEFCNKPYTIKYQLPGEDLDALISVSSNEDLQNMIEEYNGLENLDGSPRLRIILIPLSELESTCAIEANADQQQNPDFQYVVAVNGIVDHSLARNNSSRCLINEASPLISSMDQNPGIPSMQPPSFDSLEPLSLTKYPGNFPLKSLDPVPQKDLINGHSQAYKDETCGGSEIPEVMGQVFHSENPTSQPADQMDPYFGSNANVSHIPHVFSDPQLQELGGGSYFGSPDENTLASAMSLAQSESVVLEKKSVGKHENVHPLVVIDIPSMKQPVPFSQIDHTKRVHEDANCIDKKVSVAKEDIRKYVGVLTHSKENIPILCHVENFFTNTSTATANGDIISKESKVNNNQISALKPTFDFDAEMQQFSSNHLEKCSHEPALNSLKISKNKQYVVNGIENGDLRSNITCACNPDNTLTDLLSGLDNIFHESSVKLRSLHQNGKNDQKRMLISSNDEAAGVESPLCFGLSMQNPTTGAGFRREVSLMDEDFLNYTKQEIDNMDHKESYNKMLKDVLSIKDNDENQLEFADLLGDVTDAVNCSHVLDAVSTEAHLSNATEAKKSDSTVEDVATSSGSKDGPFSNALLAEMEADLYGLQIIKNSELEELKELGSGTFGTVYHGRWRGSDVAIKRIKKSCFAGRSSEEERLTNDFWREARILSNLHHPNVVAFYGVVPDGAGGTLATVTEFMTNGSLRNVLIKKDRSLDRRRKLILAMDAAFGMEYLHSKNIVHFDLKCDNLLVNMRDPQRPICKVGDFGMSRIKQKTLVSGGVRGTLPWMAPELLKGSSNRVSEKVDVFSFGITMWEILTGEEPYANMHCGAIIGGIVKDTLRPIIPEQCEPEWRNLMEQCWSGDPTLRPSFTEITNRLRAMSKTLQTNGHKKGSNS